MDFLRALAELTEKLDAEAVRYALIGGFGMAMRGVQRATVDLDFVLAMEDLDRSDQALRELGFRRYFHTDNVSHYRHDELVERIDLLHAFRRPSMAMLERAERIELEKGLAVPVAAVEDIIGLKVQAMSNDPARAEQDWLDIRLLVRSARVAGHSLDWELIGDYFTLFDKQHLLEALKEEP
jgi:predicted nucleotidyltransferase